MTDTLPQTIESVESRRISLRMIRKPVEEDLRAFRRYFRESMRSDIGILDLVTQYVLRRKGKQIRPILVLLSAKLCGGITEQSHTGAALVELLHTATLTHDDVVDDAERRRGAFSINAVWKNKVAVLFGDYLLSKGLLLALDHKAYDLLHVVSDAVRRMSEGELLQIEKARRLDIDEETYYRIISDKTASLLSACTSCGAVSATADPEIAERMRTFGEKIGLAFQIRDDLFDYGIDDVGKPVGNDIREKKITLPLIHALEKGSERDRRRILSILKKGKKSRADIQEVVRFAREKDGISYARNAMHGLLSDARSVLRTFGPSESRAALSNLVDYIAIRKK